MLDIYAHKNIRKKKRYKKRISKIDTKFKYDSYFSMGIKKRDNSNKYDSDILLDKKNEH